MKLRIKLLFMVAIPVVGLFYFSATGVIERYKVRTEMNGLQQLSEVEVKISALVHESQKERGMTAGFLSSNGTSFGDELGKQRTETDLKIADLENLLRNFKINKFDSQIGDQINGAVGTLGRIDETRQVVDRQTIGTADAIAYYTGMNTQFLSVVEKVAKLSSNAEMTNHSAAYNYFLLGKERAGIERAVLNSAFAADRFGPGMFDKFNLLVNEQDVHTKTFLSLATPEQVAFFNSKMTGQVIDEVARMRGVASSSKARSELDSELSVYLGYGGMIHYFKNYVLRGDQRYVDGFRLQYQNATSVLDRYSEITGLSIITQEQIGIIRNTIDSYNRNMALIIELRLEGKNIGEIDSSVEIDDAPAIASLNGLLNESYFGVSATYWFDTMTQKIDLLKEVEDKLASDLRRKAAALETQATLNLVFYIVLTAIIIVIATFATILITRGVLKQLGCEPSLLADVAEKVAAGNLSMQLESADKVGVGVFLAFQNMVEALKYKAGLVDQIAGGDLALKVAKASEQDGLGDSLVILVDSLNDILGQVNESVGQVSSGSNQVSQASQALSQGAAEQASSLV